MEFVEIWRVRRTLLWHAGIVAVIALIVLALPHAGTVRVNGSSGLAAPIGVLASIAAFLAAIFASSIGTSLNRESATRDLSWTKPISRTALAVRFVLVDVAGVVVAFLIAIAALAGISAYMGFAPYVDAAAPVQLVLGAGVAVMWYGLLQLLTCAFGSGARALAGILWPIAFAVGALSQLPGAIGAVMRALDVLNPLHYMSSASIEGGTGRAAVVPQVLPADERALLTWFFGLVFCAIAVCIWPRKEA